MEGKSKREESAANKNVLMRREICKKKKHIEENIP